MSICQQTDIKCYDAAEDKLLISEGCNCLPSCTAITYNAEISQARFEFNKMLKAYDNDPDEMANKSLSRMTIFFKKAEFIPIVRSELHDTIDFISNCGGKWNFQDCK